jgi:hypothetical protein
VHPAVLTKTITDKRQHRPNEDLAAVTLAAVNATALDPILLVFIVVNQRYGAATTVAISINCQRVTVRAAAMHC